MYKKLQKEAFIIAFLTALLGQIYVYPFGTSFRFSFGVIAFTLLLLYFPQINIPIASILTSLTVFVFRSSLDLIFNSYELQYTLQRHFPSMVYYIIFGTLLYLSNFRNLTDKPLIFVIYISLFDTISNIIEIAIRGEFDIEPFEQIFSLLIIIAFLRTVTTFIIYWMIKKQTLMILKEEHQKRYMHLLLLTANLKSELYFLKKSAQDIENAMKKSYEIYNKLKGSMHNVNKEIIENIIDDSLNLAIEIHEIKKDYIRIKSGLEKHIPSIDIDDFMKISDILNILKEITLEYISSIQKNINITINSDVNFLTKRYYPLFTIFNNLIQNSIEAIDASEGYIHINCSQDDKNIIFRVKDNGKGIQPKNLDVIFEPGFTTKFDEKTGKLSTGLGLYHVKKLIETMNGYITVTSNPGYETIFTITIPKKSIVYEGEVG